MDAYEATRIVFSRIQGVDPENAAKIMGLLLIQDHGEKEMIRLAFGPETLLHSVVLNARKELGLNPPSPSSAPISPSPFHHAALSRQNSASRFAMVAPPPPLTIASPSWAPPVDLQCPPDDLLSPNRSPAGAAACSPFYGSNGDFSDEFPAPDQLSFLNDPYQDMGWGPSGPHHRRSCSAAADLCLSSDGSGFGWKPCLYFARGFCKNGSSCRFLHGLPDDGAKLDAAIEQQCQELLLRSKSQRLGPVAAFPYSPTGAMPVSPSSKCMNYMFQQQQQSENHRAAAAAAAAACLMMGGDESHKYMGRSRMDRADFAGMVNPGRSKRPRQPGMQDDESAEMENLFKRAMPWLGEEICIKDAQSQNTIMPGLSLVQWMNMQQNPSLAAATMQPDYMRSLSGHVNQNLGASDLSRQLGMQTQYLQQSNIQFNASRLPQPQIQQGDQLSNMSTPLNQLNNISRPPQQIQDINLQPRQQLADQTAAMNLQQANLIQPQILVQNQAHQQQSVMQNHHMKNTIQNNQQFLQQQQQQQQHQQQQQSLQQQPILNQYQQQQHQQLQQNMIPVQISNQTNQQMLSDHQLQLQLLQKLQQQQQSYLAQSILHQSQMSQIQEQQKSIASETSQHMSSSTSLSQQNTLSQQRAKSASMAVCLPQSSPHQSQQNLQTQLPQQQILLPELPAAVFPATTTTILPTSGNNLVAAGAVQSGITDNITSCSTSPSTNNCIVLPQQILNRTQQRSMVTPEKVAQSMTILESLTANPNDSKELPKSEPCVKPSQPISSKMQCQGVVGPQAYLNSIAQMDFLDTSSSATSVCLSQTDGSLQQGFPPSSFNQPSVFRDAPPDCDVSADPRNNVLFGVNIDGPLGVSDPLLATNMDSGKYQNNISGDVVANYSTSKDAHQDQSLSMVSQSFGVADMAFNSIDSAITDNSFLNKNSWAPAPQFQRLRTYTKVYKRGAVGRSIDIGRYSGYDELKHDLARMFSIEGQLEDRQRIGWKLVYVDHESDVLLVGDDPWEEFVNCVRYIRILSPQEVQQMSLDGDLGNSIIPNQACSSSDGGNAWRGQCDQNSGNPSAGSYDHLE